MDDPGPFRPIWLRPVIIQKEDMVRLMSSSLDLDGDEDDFPLGEHPDHDVGMCVSAAANEME